MLESSIPNNVIGLYTSQGWHSIKVVRLPDKQEMGFESSVTTKHCLVVQRLERVADTDKTIVRFYPRQQRSRDLPIIT